MISQQIAGKMIQGSWIRKMFEEGNRLKALYGADQVFDFSIGNPDLEPPAEVLLAIRQLAQDETPGSHGYMSNGGYESTRAAVAKKLERTAGFAIPTASVCMTVGAAGALNVMLKTLLDPGDEVLVLAPYFVEYLSYIKNQGGIPVVVANDRQTFLPDPDAIRRAITPKTKALIINSPNNPSGRVYPASLLARLDQVLHTAPQTIYVVSDEPYADLIYDGQVFPPTMACLEHSIICSSWSKSLSLPGERIGYLAISPRCEDYEQMTDAVLYCNRSLGFVNAPAFFQRVIERTLDAKVDVTRYERRRDRLSAILQQAGFTVNKPEGGLYLFPKSPVEDDVAFTAACARHHVLLVPGSGFGFSGYVRLCFAAPESTIEGSAGAFLAIGREFGMIEC